LLLESIVAEGYLRKTGNDFLKAANKLDQRAVVQAAAAQLIKHYPNVPPDQAANLVWGDAQRLFNWVDIANLHVGGHA
jgi:hypothetical protein